MEEVDLKNIEFYEETEFKETEIGPLPKDWEVVRLGDVINTIKGKKPNIILNNWKDKVLPYLTAEYIRDKKISEYVPVSYNNNFVFVQSNDIILIWDGSNAGDVFIDYEGVLASTMIRIRPNNKNLSEKYLFYFLKTKFDLLNQKTTGSTIPHVNKNLFYSLEIPLPPISEQQKIAYVLSAIQEAKEKTERVIEATKNLKKSLMKHLFTYGPVPLSDIDKVELKETEIGPLPTHWQVVRLEEIFDVKQGKQLSSKESKENKILKPFLRTSNVLWNKIILSQISYMYFSEQEFEELKLKKGDILVCEGGDVGRTAIWKDEIKECSYQNHLHRLRAKNENIKNYFFSYWMEYGILHKKLYLNDANRTTIPNLSSSRLKSFDIPLPPLPEQQKIAEILSSVDEKIQKEEERKKALENLFKSMLHNLMTGKIRIKKMEV